MAKSANAGTIRIKQVRSIIGYDKKQGQVVRGLGLRRIGHEVDVIDHPAMRGMIQKVRHIVTVVPAGADQPAPASVAERLQSIRNSVSVVVNEAAKEVDDPTVDREIQLAWWGNGGWRNGGWRRFLRRYRNNRKGRCADQCKREYSVRRAAPIRSRPRPCGRVWARCSRG